MYQVLTQEYLDQHRKILGAPGRRLKVHVSGWDRGAVLLYLYTEDNGIHVISTTKGKVYRTANALLSLANASRPGSS